MQLFGYNRYEPKIGGLCSFGVGGAGAWVPIQHIVSGAEAYLHAKFHLDPSNRLATVHERYRQTGQRTNSTGRTLLETVTQKPFTRSLEVNF